MDSGVGWDDGNEDANSPFYGATLGSQIAIRNNGIKIVYKSKTHEKTKSLEGNEDTTARPWWLGAR